ncbi:MAG: hypothetical protein ACJ8FS_04885 [Sphingomicrobium sp.]
MYRTEYERLWPLQFSGAGPTPQQWLMIALGRSQSRQIWVESGRLGQNDLCLANPSADHKQIEAPTPYGRQRNALNEAYRDFADSERA